MSIRRDSTGQQWSRDVIIDTVGALRFVMILLLGMRDKTQEQRQFGEFIKGIAKNIRETALAQKARA